MSRRHDDHADRGTAGRNERIERRRDDGAGWRRDRGPARAVVAAAGGGPVERLRALLAERLGLAFDPRKDELLAGVLQRRAAQHALSERGYLDRLGTAWRAELAALAEAVTVGETYFFRNAEQFDALGEVVLPARLRARAAQRRLNLLSVGCATGEEAYTVAMVAADRVPASRWELSIVGLDVSRSALRKAMAGRYSRWSLRETPEPVQRRWFRPAGDGVEVDQRLRGPVRFVEHNLTDDHPALFAPDIYDVVLCRNVLMYLTPDAAAGVVDRITRALAPGGYLFLGPTDTLGEGALTLHRSHGTFYYEKVPQVAAPAPVHAARPERSRRELAVGLLADERFADALAVLDAIGGAEADRADVLLVRAATLTQLGDTGRAAELCRRLLDRDTLHPDAHHLLATCLEGDEDHPAAIEQYRVAALLDPAFALPRLRLGLLARRLGDRATAERELDRAIELLARERDERIALFGGGFGRTVLIALCRAELAAAS
ncbi:CheR family methyltransferase [Dactylosporangium sucinum]|uniref:Protein-glutamate O-methyltransferase n=1 Tax=Dactylosporangium sucinum TaxID=1424081 RepID=A0A917TP25_9ACTN|nr:CheR family methyltransferase [Dactylosporangium sucinum]GGM29904.1 protein-glutamate O-methyltransferase [Dactylosporangium sucinum]